MPTFIYTSYWDRLLRDCWMMYTDPSTSTRDQIFAQEILKTLDRHGLQLIEATENPDQNIGEIV